MTSLRQSIRREPLIKRAARLLLPLITSTVTLQPLAYAAPSPSLLTQMPRFVDLEVYSNVAFIMDDSLSMEDIRLPVPANLSLGETAGTVSVRGAATGWTTSGWAVGPALSDIDRVNEWIYRSSTLNPLYYNPALTYAPWNDNGREGAAGSNFLEAKVGNLGEIKAGNGFRFGVTAHDMRYVGPNYSHGVGANLNRYRLTTGANPPALPESLLDTLTSTRPANGGFTGQTLAGCDETKFPGCNADLFTSPMVEANGGSQQCVVDPTDPSSTSIPSVARDGVGRVTSNRTPSTRPSTALPTSDRTAQDRGSQSRPVEERAITTRPSTTATTEAATVTGRGNTGLTITTRAVTDRPSTALPSTSTRTSVSRPSTAVTPTTTRTFDPRPSTPVAATTARSTIDRPSTTPTTSDRTTQSRPSYSRPADSTRNTQTRPSTTLPATVDRTLSARPKEYRQETGDCGNWGAWQPTRPANTTCTLNSEAGSRLAVIEERYTSCPTGTSVYGSDSTQCVSDCPSGSTASGLQCTYSCPTGTNQIGSQCYSACPSGYSINGSASSSTQCISDCPTGTTASGTQCIGACNSGDTLIGSQCYSACGSGFSVNPDDATQCISNCPTGTTASGGQCVTNCATGTNSIGGQCYSACPTGYSLNGSASTATQCISDCPTGTTASGTQCVGTCPSGTTQIGSQCYSACGSGYSIYSGDATQCISNCPANTTASGTQCVGTCPSGQNLIGGQCYSACPAGYSLNGSASTATQCISDCPANTTPTATQCVAACASGTTQIGSQCYSACPTGTAINPDNPAQCIANCPTGTTTNGNQCESCASGYPTRIGNLCYASCGSATINPNNTAQCLSCASGTLNATTAQCTNVCPTGTTLISGQCYSACPAGTTVRGTTGTARTQCIANCPTGTTPSGTQCLGACPSGYPNLETSSATTCYANCPTGFSVNSGNYAQCLSDCPSGQSVVSVTQCRGTTCPTGNDLIGGQCYGACPSGSSIDGSATTSTQCLSDCPAGATTSDTQCIEACPSDHPTLVGSTCYANCPTGYPTVNPSNAAQCLGACPAGSTTSGSQCLSCPTGSTMLESGQCCPSLSVTLGNCPVNRPEGASCDAGNWVPDLDKAAPAHYYVFAPATEIASPTPAQLMDPANYVRVEINRDRRHEYPKAAGRMCTKPDEDGDGQLDCWPGQCSGDTCTWDEEAQNFANWFTYYRTRLFSAIAVTAASLSGLKTDDEKNLGALRLAYGSINYFPYGRNPYTSSWFSGPRFTLDGDSESYGTLVRGVRSFTEVSPPPDPGSDDRRQEVFDWLFSLRAVGATPNREAVDSVGRYFTRTDSQGPWIQPADESAGWSSDEAALDHFSCRRNYMILVTDGEWTRTYSDAGSTMLPQPLIESRASNLPLADGGAWSNALSQSGPAIADTDYSYVPADEPQFSTNASSAGYTLSDFTLYYWSRDLRPDLPNVAGSADGTTAPFWQNMVSYLVGYGITASRDTTSNRQKINDEVAVSWPTVAMELRSTPEEKQQTIITDRDTIPVAPDPAAYPGGATGYEYQVAYANWLKKYDCGYSAANPAGCGRVDDTFRAAMAARGDFLSATDIASLAASVAQIFGSISATQGTATALTGRSGTIQSGDRLYSASFCTNSWIGQLQSFDAGEYFAALTSGTTPASVGSRFPAAASRNVLTAIAGGTGAGRAFPTGAGNFNNLSAGQQAALNGDATLAQWLRGDQSTEVRNGGSFRNRLASGSCTLTGIMGDIINSQPYYSKYRDEGYQSARKPAADTSGSSDYRNFVTANKQHRPARVYVGANDGMLHAFDVEGSLDPEASNYNENYMNEVFAYVPRAVYGRLAALATPGYTHRYYVDGPIVEGDVYVGGAWKTVIVGTTGAGPTGVFALDVTQNDGTAATSMGVGSVLWDVAATDTATNVEHLGHILQPGVIGSGKDGNWYYFVGNGYESTDDKAKLLAINIADGSITAIDTDTAGGSDPDDANLDQRPNGLGGITPVYDANRNIVAVYAGDRLGRLWKFDLSSDSRSAWTSTKLFTAADGSSQRQPITAAPRVLNHPLGGRMIVFGTGKIFERDDLRDESVQSVYGVWEKDVSTPAVVAKSDLFQFKLIDQDIDGARYRHLVNENDDYEPSDPDDSADAYALDWSTHKGWYFDLVSSTGAQGERIVAAPVENYGFVNVTSYQPVDENGDPCSGSGASYFYRLDVAGSFTRSAFSNVSGTSIVGSELDSGTVNQLQMLLLPAAGTTATSTSLTQAQTAAIAGGSAAAATNPCLGSLAGGQSVTGSTISSPNLNCPVTPLRVWRDIPRGAR